MMAWVHLPKEVPLIKLHEDLYPDEGHTVQLKLLSGVDIVGYMVWSGTYRFIALDDDLEPTGYIDDVIAWRYYGE